jgi:hypothetical protein
MNILLSIIHASTFAERNGLELTTRARLCLPLNSLLDPNEHESRRYASFLCHGLIVERRRDGILTSGAIHRNIELSNLETASVDESNRLLGLNFAGPLRLAIKQYGVFSLSGGRSRGSGETLLETITCHHLEYAEPFRRYHSKLVQSAIGFVDTDSRIRDNVNLLAGTLIPRIKLLEALLFINNHLSIWSQ